MPSRRRPLFGYDPEPGGGSRSSRPETTGKTDGKPRALAVTELNNLARRSLEREFPRVLVEGEISNFTAASSGHLYFSLKDDRSQIGCVVWRTSARRLSFRPGNGIQVRARGKLTIYEAGGRYQFVAEHLEEAGLGDLERRFQELKAEFEARGWFDAELKRRLPFLPETIGVVTSTRGAAIRDIVSTAVSRFALASILVRDVRVQGEGAAIEIADAIRQLSTHRGVDVLIVGRGGGSLEDLWSFNDPRVVEAIHECPIPVISAVGHEVDFTLSDFVADHRAATPTAAAEAVVPDLDRLVQDLGQFETALKRRLGTQLESMNARLLAIASSWALREPRHLVERAAQRLDEVAEQLPRALRRRVEREQDRLEGLSRSVGFDLPTLRIESARDELSRRRDRLHRALKRRWELATSRLEDRARLLEGLSPLAILERGYSLTRDAETGEIVKDAAKLSAGQRLKTRLARGEVESTVDHASEPPASG